eukprot:COSAG01_NODE_649_length_14487_cov_12.974624_3_plen_85_part_00
MLIRTGATQEEMDGACQRLERYGRARQRLLLAQVLVGVGAWESPPLEVYLRGEAGLAVLAILVDAEDGDHRWPLELGLAAWLGA